MIAVRKMKMAVDEVTGMIAVRNGFVPAVGTVHVPLLMAFTVMIWGATRRIGVVHLENMLFHVAPVGVVEAAVVKIVDVTVVQDGGVAAIGTVSMIVMGMITGHDVLLCLLEYLFK